MASLLLLLALGDLRTPGEVVLEELAREPTPALLREAAQLYRYPASPEEREKLFTAIGAATKDRSAEIRVAALLAVAETGDGRAGALLEPHLREGNPSAEEKQVVLTAIEAAGQLRIESLVNALLNLAKGSRDMTVADESLLALGAFHDTSTRERKALFERVLGLAKALERDKRKWRRLAAPALRSLQLLSGKRLSTLDLFTEWWKVAKEEKDPFTPARDGS